MKNIDVEQVELEKSIEIFLKSSNSKAVESNFQLSTNSQTDKYLVILF